MPDQHETIAPLDEAIVYDAMTALVRMLNDTRLIEQVERDYRAAAIRPESLIDWYQDAK